jgi:fluoride exporter
MPFLWVGLGGLIGSLCRYGCTLMLSQQPGTTPWGTLASNLAGCFVIGMVSQIAADTELLTPAARLFLATGFCGGFTTLSSLIYELIQMVQAREWLHAMLYLNGTFFGAVATFLLGTMMIKTFARIG